MADLIRRLPPPVQGAVRALADWCEKEIGEIKDAFGGNIEWHNWRSKLVNVSAPTNPGDPFVIEHNLGKIPEFFIANTTDGSTVYARTTDKDTWTTRTMILRCTGSGPRVTLVVM